MRRVASVLAPAFAVLALSLEAAAQMSATSPSHELINAKCTRCHSSDRVLKADPKQLRGILDRMERKDPELFRDTDSAALTEGLLKVLNDPAVVAGRTAWDETVAKGRDVFKDTSLGTTGKSCNTCHRPEDLKDAAERYPTFDAKLGRLVSLQERLRMMIQSKLGGKELPLGDIRTVALEAYLKSLR
jgi:mono/diheme cytochrome c family protein